VLCQLGIGERGTVARPRLVTALLRHPIAQLACRGAHVLALDASGQVWAWGRNDDGQLGVDASAGDASSPSPSHGAGDERELAGRPQRVEALGGRRVTNIGCGRTHSVALTAQGELYRVARALGLGLGLGLLGLGLRSGLLGA
jgi:alpha-tubulin suppressor-like RCC1 family protein